MDTLTWLRRTCFAEAISWPALLFVSVMKHFGGWTSPWPVRVLGMSHGVLFLLLIWLLVQARFERGWPGRRLGLLFVASLIPGWPFFLDRRFPVWMAPQGPAGDRRA